MNRYRFIDSSASLRATRKRLAFTVWDKNGPSAVNAVPNAWERKSFFRHTNDKCMKCALWLELNIKQMHNSINFF